MTVLDHTHAAHVFNQRGLRVNQVAARLDLSNSTVEQFLSGTLDPSDLRIANLIGIADILGIPFTALFTQPGPGTDLDDNTAGSGPDDNETDPDADVFADAEQLIAVLYDNGNTATVIREVATALGWTMDRVRAAATAADTRLRPAGLRMINTHSELTVVPVRDHHNARTALAERKVYERGLTHGHYKAAYQLLNSNPVTVANSQRQRDRVIGGLVNLGITTAIKNPQLTDAAHEAFI